MDTIQETLATFIATHILHKPGRTIDPAEKLISSGLIDSFNLVDLAIHIEEKLGVQIDDTELTATTFDTLAELAELIRQRQGAQ